MEIPLILLPSQTDVAIEKYPVLDGSDVTKIDASSVLQSSRVSLKPQSSYGCTDIETGGSDERTYHYRN